MFIISLKSTKTKIVLLILFVVLFAVLAAVFISSNSAKQTAASNGDLVLRAKTNDERLAFFAQFGWQADQDAAEVKEIVIPEHFDDVYEAYNALQKQQGFDLSAYCGKRVKSWSYRILNYPGYEAKPDLIRGNLLVYDDTVIGGDISSIELDGFMKPFQPQEAIESSLSDPLLHLGE